MKISEKLFNKLWDAVQDVLCVVKISGQSLNSKSTSIETLSEVCEEIIKERDK